MQAEGDLQNGAAAKRKRKGPSVKERLMRCQRTERERLTFGKASLMRASLHARPHMLNLGRLSACVSLPRLALHSSLSSDQPHGVARMLHLLVACIESHCCGLLSMQAHTSKTACITGACGDLLQCTAAHAVARALPFWPPANA